MSDRARSKRHSLALASLAVAGAIFAALPASADIRVASVFSNWSAADANGSTQGRIEGVRMAGADCSAAAAEAAAQTGGQVLSVSSRSEGGRVVCIVTLLVPGEDGQRPRKRTLTLPQ